MVGIRMRSVRSKAVAAATVTLLMLLTTLGFSSVSSAQGTNETNDITFRFRGSTGEENVSVAWEDNIVGRSLDVSTEWTEYSFTIPVTALTVSILFDNDGLTEAGADKNLIVDWMEFDGERVQIESSGVFSKGVYNGVDCGEGFRQSEFLACNGFFRFEIDRTTDPDPLEIPIRFEALGTTGSEIVELEIDNQVVASWTLTTEANTWYRYVHETFVDIERARILFTNDGLDGNGVDRNVRVSAVIVDGSLISPIEMESKGSWNGTDCGIGFRRSLWLHCNGWFEVPVNDSPDPDSVFVTVTARGSTGTEIVHLVARPDRIAAVWNLSTTDEQYRIELPNVEAYDGLRISFVNDGLDTDLRDRNVRVDTIVIGREIQDAKDLYSKGSWNGTDCGLGFRNSNWLHCNGWFETISG